MFSQASVSHSVHALCPRGVYMWGVGTQPWTWTRGGGYPTHPPLLTPSGGQRTYGRQAGSTHPTGMHSC